VVFSAQQSLVVKKYLSMHNVTAECKWFWKWCITLRIIGFMDRVHNPEF
jgi:hypothetical protein